MRGFYNPNDIFKTPMSTLICGSIAFDSIMVFHDRFRNHILPEQIHLLNVSFLVPELRREFGGCAGNIAYSLKQLGGEPLIMATLGKDGELYRNHLDQQGMNLKHVLTVEDDYTAQAIIITDQDNNQITAFHPGAMGQAHRLQITADPGIQLAIVAPDGRGEQNSDETRDQRCAHSLRRACPNPAPPRHPRVAPPRRSAPPPPPPAPPAP